MRSRATQPPTSTRSLVLKRSMATEPAPRTQAVNAMLLNEFLKEHRKVEEQQATIIQLKSAVARQEATIARQQNDFGTIAARQENEIQALTAHLKEQAAQIQKVSAQIEMRTTASQLVRNQR